MVNYIEVALHKRKMREIRTRLFSEATSMFDNCIPNITITMNNRSIHKHQWKFHVQLKTGCEHIIQSHTRCRQTYSEGFLL